jgi:hypothetical protein
MGDGATAGTGFVTICIITMGRAGIATDPQFS